jgi:hypothetical protein
VLRDAINKALTDGLASTGAMVADGEGYGVEIALNDQPWEHPSWETAELPYFDPTAHGKPDPHARIAILEHALRQANAALFKRGVKPVTVPDLNSTGP